MFLNTSSSEKSYKKSSTEAGYTVTTAFSAQQIVTQLTIASYALGDQDITVKIDRTDVSPAGATKTLNVDQFGGYRNLQQ